MATKLFNLPEHEKIRLKERYFTLRNGSNETGAVKERPWGCHEWRSATSGSRVFETRPRYGTVSVKKFLNKTDRKHVGHFTVNSHVLSYFLQHDTLPDDRTQVISHVCGNSKCVNAVHLVIEPQAVNLRRGLCFAGKKCTQEHVPHCKIIKVS